MSFQQVLNYECSCGEIKVQIKSASFVRLFCHCSICQSIFNESYADDIIVLAKDVTVENSGSVIYRKHTSFFPIHRGECKHCKAPVISFSSLIPFVKLAITPTCFYSVQTKLPNSVAHFFYRNNKTPINDSLPKYNDYLSSQINTIKYVLYSIIKRLWSK
jgi:hypothetical protein